MLHCNMSLLGKDLVSLDTFYYSTQKYKCIMENIVSYSVVYNFRRRLNGDGTAPVHIRLYSKSDKKRKYVDTGVRVKPEFWDDDQKIVRKKYVNYTFLNQKITDKLAYFQKLEMRCMTEGVVFDWSIIDNDNNNVDPNKSFIVFAEERIKLNNSVGKATIAGELNAIRHFKEFVGDISFRAIDYSTISDFDNYLKRPESPLKSEFSIYDIHKVIRKYIKEAIILKYITSDNYPYSAFKLKMANSKRHGMRMDELKKVETVKTYNNKRFELSKDLFLFSCYTGIRWGDVVNLKRNNVFIDEENESNSVIRLATSKTSAKVVLPIGTLFEGKPVSIIKKYISKDREKIFPAAKNNKVNLHLKQISSGADLPYLLTFHMARHTFGTILAELYPDPYLIKSLMGHRDIKTSMVYIQTSSKVVADKIKNIKWS